MQAQQAVDRPVLEALALRQGVARPFAREVIAAVARAERLGLLDDDDDRIRWGAVNGVHAQLVEIVEAHPDRWDDAIRDAESRSAADAVTEAAARHPFATRGPRPGGALRALSAASRKRRRNDRGAIRPAASFKRAGIQR